MPPRRQGRNAHEQLRLDGLDSSIHWENEARLETAEKKLREAQGVLADALQSAIAQVLEAQAAELAVAVSEYNAALDSIGVQIEELRRGPTGRGSQGAQDALVGGKDAISERHATLFPMTIHVEEVEIVDTGELSTGVEVTVHIPHFGDAHARDDKVVRTERYSAWTVLSTHSPKVGPGSR